MKQNHRLIWGCRNAHVKNVPGELKWLTWGWKRLALESHLQPLHFQGTLQENRHQYLHSLPSPCSLWQVFAKEEPISKSLSLGDTAVAGRNRAAVPTAAFLVFPLRR